MPDLAADAVDWDAAVDLGDGLVVHAEPTQHWSARGTGDRSHALWASFVVQAGAKKIYCVGDSGFGTGATFERVRGRHPGLDAGTAADRRLRAALVHAHVPHEPRRVRCRRCSCAAPPRRSGITGAPSTSPTRRVEQPAIDLTAALAKHGIAPERFPALRPGEVRTV